MAVAGMVMSEGHTFGGAVRWNFVGASARIVITLVVQVALLRLLGPVVAGQFAIFLIIVGIGTVLSEGGVMAAIARSPTLDEQTVRNAIFVVLCYSIIVTTIILVCTWPLIFAFNLTLHELYIPIVAALNILPLGLSSVPLSMLRRQYRARDVQIVQIGAYVLGFGLFGLPLALVYQSAAVMAAAFTVQSFATLVAAMAFARCPILPRMRGARMIQASSWRAVLSNVAFYLGETAPGILTANTIGPRALGIYSTAFNLLRTPTDALVNALHAPLLVSTAEDHGGAETRARLLSTLNLLASTAFAFFFTVFLGGDQLVLPLLGAKWADAGPVLSIVGLIMVARLLSMLAGAVIWGQGRMLADSAAQAISFAMIIVAFVLLHPANASTVASIVLAAVATRMVIQLAIVVHSCAITAPMLWSGLLLPAAMSGLAMLPMNWIMPMLLPHYGLAGLFATATIAALLLAARIALGMWLTPAAWTRSLIDTGRSVVRRGAAKLASKAEITSTDKTE